MPFAKSDTKHSDEIRSIAIQPNNANTIRDAIAALSQSKCGVVSPTIKLTINVPSNTMGKTGDEVGLNYKVDIRFRFDFKG
jgi:hypothetical protein